MDLLANNFSVRPRPVDSMLQPILNKTLHKVELNYRIKSLINDEVFDSKYSKIKVVHGSPGSGKVR